MDGTPRRAKTAAMQQTQQDVDEVVGIMKNNIEKVLEREQRLEMIEEDSETLKDRAGHFSDKSVLVKKKMRTRANKWRCLVVLMVLAVLIAIALVIYTFIPH